MKYKEHSEYQANYQNLWNTFDILNLYIQRYSKSRNLKLCIAMHSPENALNDEDLQKIENEESYWKNIFHDDAILNPLNISKLSSYKVMFESELIVGVASTLLLEAFGMGKKILYCDFTSNNIFHDYNSSILFRENDYHKFANRLDDLRSEPYGQYLKKNKKYASYLMNNDLDNPPHLAIRKLVQDIL